MRHEQVDLSRHERICFEELAAELRQECRWASGGDAALARAHLARSRARTGGEGGAEPRLRWWQAAAVAVLAAWASAAATSALLGAGLAALGVAVALAVVVAGLVGAWGLTRLRARRAG